MPKTQFTVNPEGFTSIGPEGVVIIDRLGASAPAGSGTKPVKVAVHRDLTLQLHGARFSASTKLTPDDALALANMLIYLVREQL